MCQIRRCHVPVHRGPLRPVRAQALRRILSVAPGGYYARLKEPLSNRAQEDARRLRLIRVSFTASQGMYGAPRVFLDLREAEEPCSKRRVARLIREQPTHSARVSNSALVGREARGLDPQSPPATVYGDAPEHGLGDGYDRQSHAAGAALPSGGHGSLFAHDHRLGRRPTNQRELVLNAILAGVRCRPPRGTPIHSDQGTRWGCYPWRRLCRAHDLEPSMSPTGNCRDNAVAGSFSSTLKKERIEKHIYRDRKLAATDVADYIETL